jgi:hypothetical protein
MVKYLPKTTIDKSTILAKLSDYYEAKMKELPVLKYAALDL